MVKLNSGLYCAKIFLDETAALGLNAFDEHAEEIDEVLTRMETVGLQVNMQKSKWAVTQAKRLGSIAPAHGRSPEPAKTQGLVVMKEFKSKRQV